MQSLSAWARPIIAVGGDLEAEGRPTCRLNLEYADAVARAGGVPLIVPPLEDGFEEAIAAADGFLFTGGDDYDPAAYDQPRHPTSCPVHPRRDLSDRLLAALALESGRPILGICGGLQLINIVLGGDLIQDIPSLISGPVVHRASPGSRPARHSIGITPGTLLDELVGSRPAIVNSYHHQAAGRLGRGLRVSASTVDGVVEAIEATTRGRFLLGVQWHPERDPDELSAAVFGGLVEAARRREGGTR